MAELPDPPDRLDSWKEVAHFLGRTVRTVQRWEKTEGLPVHRGGPSKRGAVVGSKREIGEWWQRRGPSLVETDEGEAADPPSDSTVPDAGRQWMRTGIWTLAVAAGTLALIFMAGAPDPATARSEKPLEFARLLAMSTSENQSIREIPIGTSPAELVVTPDGRRIFVAVFDAPAVAMIDIAASRITGRIPLHENPVALAISPAGDRLYAGGSQELAIVDLRTLAVTRLPVGGSVRDLAVTADGRRVWISLAQAGIKVLDVATGRLEVRPTIGCPMYFALHPPDRLFVSYQCGGPGGRRGHDAIEIIDEPSRRSVLTRSGPPLVGSFLEMSPDGLFLWAEAADACEPTSDAKYDGVGCPPGAGAVVHALSSTTLEPVATVRVPARHYHGYPAYFPDGTRVAFSLNGLSVINAALGHVEERLELDTTGSLVFVPHAGLLAVTDVRRGMLNLFTFDSQQDARGVDGIASYWAGDGTMNDLVSSVHGVDGSVAGYAPGRLGRAFSFGAGSGEISFGVQFAPDIRWDPATLSAWIKPRLSGAAMTILDRAGPVGWRWWITTGGQLAFCMNDSLGPIDCQRGGLVSNRPLTTGMWHHVAVVRSSTSVDLFVGAERVATISLDGYVRPLTGLYDDRRITRLGSSAGRTTPFAGLIDEVATFRRALTAADLARVARATSAQGR